MDDIGDEFPLENQSLMNIINLKQLQNLLMIRELHCYNLLHNLYKLIVTSSISAVLLSL